MNITKNHVSSAVSTVIGFALLWPISARAVVAFVIRPFVERGPQPAGSLMSGFIRSFEQGLMQSVSFGLVAGGVLALAGLHWNRPPYWVVLLVAIAAASLPWIMDTGDRSTGLEGFAMIVTTVAGGVSVLVWGLLTRLIWSGASR